MLVSLVATSAGQAWHSRVACEVSWLVVHPSVNKASAGKMTPVGFEPTQLALVELESTPLDHSGKVSLLISALRFISLRSTKEKEEGRQAGRQAGKH